jgi:hypothetical protein
VRGGHELSQIIEVLGGIRQVRSSWKQFRELYRETMIAIQLISNRGSAVIGIAGIGVWLASSVRLTSGV